jgi:hypothetical protein
MRSFVGSPEVPCVRCGTRTAGLAWGAECASCLKLTRQRARRVASRISVLAALIIGFDVWLQIPAHSPLRLYGGIAVLVTYLLVYQIASRVAMEVYAREPRKGISDADR